MESDVIYFYPENKQFISGEKRELAQVKNAKIVMNYSPIITLIFFGIIIFFIVTSPLDILIKFLFVAILIYFAFKSLRKISYSLNERLIKYNNLLASGRIIDGKFIRMIDYKVDSESDYYSVEVEYEFTSPITNKTIRKQDTISRKEINDLKFARPYTKIKILYLNDEEYEVL